MAQRVEHNPMEAGMAALVSHGLGGFNCGCPSFSAFLVVWIELRVS